MKQLSGSTTAPYCEGICETQPERQFGPVRSELADHAERPRPKSKLSTKVDYRRLRNIAWPFTPFRASLLEALAGGKRGLCQPQGDAFFKAQTLRHQAGPEEKITFVFGSFDDVAVVSKERAALIKFA